MSSIKNTNYGKKYNVSNVKNLQDFKKAFPVTDYEHLFPYIDKMMQGESDILWPGKTTWFAKSSGTTNDKSKFIPITDDNLFDNHVAASWDAMAVLYGNRMDARIFEGKIDHGRLTS
ncbi:MAG: GH3 auxin-responsive promoter family protein [Saprospiraceae bacterium]|nr:GH3 auxin-responsive promoter family protein [Saprospiraceae bacterium]